MFDRSDTMLFFCGLLVAGLVALGVEQNEAPEMALTLTEGDLPAVRGTIALGAAPRQIPLDRRQVVLGGGYTADLLDSYILAGRVVTRKEFRHSGAADVSPLDLGIIWGDLLAPQYDGAVAYTAGHRLIRFAPDPTRDLPEKWNHGVTNNHLIPASAAVRAALLAVEVGQDVRLTGFLVTVRGGGMSPWESSRVRGDGFPAGCEIILVTRVEVLSGAVAGAQAAL